MRLYSKSDWNQNDPKIHISSATTKIGIAPHTHDFIEIVYIRDGSAVQCVNGIEYEVKRGDLLFINYGATHSYRPNPEFSYINVAFYPEKMGERISNENAFGLFTLTAFEEILEEEHGVVSFLGMPRVEVEDLLNSMLREQESGKMLREMAMDAYMELLIVTIVRKVSGEIEGDDLWPDIARYIEENLDQDLSLSALSRKCFYNPSYFSRIFRERYSIPLSEYVMQKRVERAHDLLLTTEYTINKVATLVGFNNKSFFYKIFYKFYQMTPMQCRKNGQRLQIKKEPSNGNKNKPEKN